MANSPSGESVLSRIVRILETFSEEKTSQTPSEIGRAAGLPRSTAYRLVDDLTEAGLLDRNEDNELQLGLRLWELALRGSTVLRLRQAGLPYMEEIQAHIREHTQLAVLEQDEALFLERLSHNEAGPNITLVAGRLPLHASSSGLVLLAYANPEIRNRVLARPLAKVGPETITDPARLERELRTIRTQGYVIAPGTVQAVSTGIAVPIRDAGVVKAALSVILPREADPTPALKSLQQAAKKIEAALQQSAHSQSH